ncbi:hypothetical protein SDC9_208172 [bioreactor metagenome]|uniref:Uncharacterized protein n=1 Tax=bioreactor metagenome TaxID=1076179 RepID=A0A645JJC2_9ZZZZ
MILGIRTIADIIADASALDFLDILNGVKIDAILIVNPAVGIAQSDNLGAKSLGFFGCVDGDVARTGNNHRLVFQRIAELCQHFLYEINKAVASRFRTGKRTAVG